MAKSNNTFSNLMLYVSKERNKTFNAIYKELEEVRIDCSKRAFYNYCNGETVPEFNMACLILDALDVDYSETSLHKTLLDSLEATTRKKNNNDFVITTGVSLPLRKMSSVQDDEVKIQELLDERVVLTATSFSDYLCRLIREDIDKHILKERKKV